MVLASNVITLARVNDGATGNGVSKTEVYYYLSTSNTTQSGGSWSTTVPDWVNGRYYWMKVKTTYTSGTTAESSPVCITGAQGETGSTGTGVNSITTEFYLSTSKTSQTDGSWVTTMPTWSTGKYLWTRNKIVYKNPSSTVYTTPVCDSSWEAVNEVKDDIDEAQSTADQALSTAESNTTRVNNAVIDIDALKASISSLVTGQHGESLMTQTETGWSFSLANVLNTLNSATNNINSLNSSMSATNSAVSTLNSTVNDLGRYTNYIKFGTDNGKPCIILGETDSAFKVIITNTDIRFMEGSSIPASISNQSLYIGKAVIREELRQGGFAWMARSNGNYGLLWKGE